MSEWYEDRANLALLARHMGEQGDGVEQVAYMLEKPWKFADEWRGAVAASLALCGQEFPSPSGPPAICNRLAGHPPVSADGIGHCEDWRP